MSKREVHRSPRVQTSIAAVLVDSDGGPLPAEIVDLSGGGFRLHTTEPLIVGEELQLRVLRYGEFKAKLLCVEGHDAGGFFLEQFTL